VMWLTPSGSIYNWGGLITFEDLTDKMYSLPVNGSDLHQGGSNLVVRAYDVLGQLNAGNNYWGADTGPYHAVLNPNGTGDTITGNVSYEGWIGRTFDLRDYDPPSEPTNVTVDTFEFYDPHRDLYFIEKNGTYNISFQGPSIQDDPSLENITVRWWTQGGSGFNGDGKVTYEDLTGNNYSLQVNGSDLRQGGSYLSVRASDILGQVSYTKIFNYEMVETLTDLSMKNITVSNETILTGQPVEITVVVKNGGDFSENASNVNVVVSASDGFGNQYFIGYLEFGTIDPSKDYYPNESALGPGEIELSMWWTPLPVDYSEKKNLTIRAQVDP